MNIHKITEAELKNLKKKLTNVPDELKVQIVVVNDTGDTFLQEKGCHCLLAKNAFDTTLFLEEETGDKHEVAMFCISIWI